MTKQPTITPPPGCSTLEDHERHLVSLAERLEEKLAAFIADADGRLGMSAINATAAQIIAARRRAAELARMREDATRLDHALELERRRIEGPRAARTPLRRKETP